MAARREVCQGRAELRPCHSIPLPMTHIGPYLHTFDIIRTHAPGPHNNVAVPERSVMVCATMLLVYLFFRSYGAYGVEMQVAKIDTKNDPA